MASLDRGDGDVTHVGPVVRGACGPVVLLSLSTCAYPGMQRRGGPSGPEREAEQLGPGANSLR